MVQPLWRTLWRFLRKLKVEIPYDLAIPLLGIYPKELEMGLGEILACPMFVSRLFTMTKKWKQPKCLPKDEWRTERGLNME